MKTGGTFSLNWTNNRQTTNSVTSTYSPALNSSFTLGVTQPLLRNLKIDSPRQQLRLAKKGREISDVQFKQTVVNTISTVKKAYYDYIYAIDNLAVSQRNLSLAQKLQNENEIKVKVGTMAPLEVVSAKAEVAAREEGVIVADAAVREAEDNMRRLLFPANDPRIWSVSIQPTDRPTAEPFPVDMEGAVTRALAERTDVVSARLNLERSGYAVQYARNQTLPGVDLVASYGGSGLGGTRMVRDGFDGPVVSETVTGWGDVYGNVFGFDFPTWVVRVNASYSIRNRSAKAAHAVSPDFQAAGRGVAPSPRASGGQRGALHGSSRRDELQARGLYAGGPRPGRAATRCRGEEIRRRNDHQLPGHPGATRPRPGPGQRNPRRSRLSQEPRGVPALSGGRRRILLGRSSCLQAV